MVLTFSTNTCILNNTLSRIRWYSLFEGLDPFLLVLHLCHDLLELSLEPPDPRLGEGHVRLEQVRVILGAAHTRIRVHYKHTKRYIINMN